MPPPPAATCAQGESNAALNAEVTAQLEAMDADSDNRVSCDEFLEHLSMMTSVLGDTELRVFLQVGTGGGRRTAGGMGGGIAALGPAVPA